MLIRRKYPSYLQTFWLVVYLINKPVREETGYPIVHWLMDTGGFGRCARWWRFCFYYLFFRTFVLRMSRVTALTLACHPIHPPTSHVINLVDITNTHIQTCRYMLIILSFTWSGNRGFSGIDTSVYMYQWIDDNDWHRWWTLTKISSLPDDCFELVTLIMQVTVDGKYAYRLWGDWFVSSYQTMLFRDGW